MNLRQSSATYVYVDDIAPGLDIDFERYRDSERDLITPALLDAGFYPIGEWRDGERDSWGPLSRCIDADTKDGKRVTVVYG